MNTITKKTRLISLLVVLIFINVSCRKTGNIKYPVSTNYGENLFLSQTSAIEAAESYSLEAELTKNSNLTIVFHNLSENPSTPGVNIPKWGTDFMSGWKAGNYNADGTQTFTTTKTGLSDAKIVFTGTTPGKCKIEMYENSSTVTNTKIYTW